MPLPATQHSYLPPLGIFIKSKTPFYIKSKGKDIIVLGRRAWHTQEFCSGGGGSSTNSVEDRGQGSGGGSPLVRGSEGRCNFVKEISFRIIKSS